MTDYGWTGDAGDSQWSDAGNWSPNGVPGNGGTIDDAFINDPSAAIVLNNVTKYGYQISNVYLGGTLTINGIIDITRVFTVSNASSVIVNGEVQVDQNISNSGYIEIDSGGVLDVFGETLAGSGITRLVGGAIGGAGIIGGFFENSGSTIEGYGAIGNNYDFALQNDAGSQIIAEGGALDLDPGEGSANGGLLVAEASGPFDEGTLLIESDVENTVTTVNGTSRGTIEALGTGDLVELDNMTVTGGTIETVDGGMIKVGDGTSTSATATLDDVVLDGRLDVGRNNTLGIGGTYLTASGLITVDGGAINLSGDVEIAGTASIQLTKSASTPGQVLGTDGDTFTNDV